MTHYERHSNFDEVPVYDCGHFDNVAMFLDLIELLYQQHSEIFLSQAHLLPVQHCFPYQGQQEVTADLYLKRFL